MNKIINLGEVNVKLYSTGFIDGFETKRPATIKEVRRIFYNIFGINISNLNDFGGNTKDYDEYNKNMAEIFNGWLNGSYDDQSIMDFAYDCSDEQLGLFNLIPLIIYLKEKEII